MQTMCCQIKQKIGGVSLTNQLSIYGVEFIFTVTTLDTAINDSRE